MSKVQQAKEAQGYNPKPMPATCMNCRHFTSKKETMYRPWDTYTWTKESELRCGLGGFAVKKSATCDDWRGKY